MTLDDTFFGPTAYHRTTQQNPGPGRPARWPLRLATAQHDDSGDDRSLPPCHEADASSASAGRRD